MLTKKNLIILHGNGRGMCALLRGGAIANISQACMTGEFEFVQAPELVRDEYIVKHAVAVIIDRAYTEEHATMVRHYAQFRRKYGLRVILDYDDVMWDIGGESILPEYNPANLDAVQAGKIIERVADRIDAVFVTCPWLAACWKTRFGSEATVVPNFLPLHLYGQRTRRIDARIGKPVVLYGGSPFHYRDGMEGDFAGPWIPWLKDAVKDGSIELHMFRPEAWMFKDVADRIVWHDPVHSIMWPMTLRDVAPDIYIAPLQDNAFNRAKSDLKYSEACAIGAAFVGSWWKESCPYAEQHELGRVTPRMTAEKLREKVEVLRDPEAFNAVMDHQERHAAAMWLEDRRNLGRVLGAIVGLGTGA